MGVPAFFRWLSRKYVSIIVDAVEDKNRDMDGTRIPVDATKPNPNFQEFDNLYLDMNGIIHPCTHPEDRPAPKTEDEMFVLIFEYIDRLFSIVRPRRVLYMAIDGVAPRAKMNQQRSRRFRAAKEADDKKEQILSVRKKLAEEGIPLPPARKEEEHFDSNCITPGTPFMDRLAVALRYYVHERITNDAAWQSIQVILSDANVPGEGEHKIMDYIRRQRASPSHDPNTVHCLCGADADLIMLGLATHEPNFNILREEFVPNQPRACELCGQYGHELDNCKGLAREEAGPDQADPLKKEKNFIFIRLPVLREYLAHELKMPNLPFEYDFERAIDDWVFMCFFVGNDFLPHLPSLEIRENAIDRLIKLYKDVVYQVKGWLTEDGEVFMERVQMIMVELGKVEDEIFKTRQIKEVRYRENSKQRRRREKAAASRSNDQHNSSLNSQSSSGSYVPNNSPYYNNRSCGQLRADAQPFVPRANFAVPPPPILPYHVNPQQQTGGYNSWNQRSPYGAPPPIRTQYSFGYGGPPHCGQQGNYSTNSPYSRNQYGNNQNSGGGYNGRDGTGRIMPHNASLIAPLSSAPAYMSGSETRQRAAQDRLEQQECAEATKRLNAILQPLGSKRHADDSPGQAPPAKSFKDGAGQSNARGNGNPRGSDSEEEPNDDIRLWEDGWKDRYYNAKFGRSESDVEFRRKVAWAYAEGLCWVMKYYYQGCASWTWYFPYHYAPFASDFDTIADCKVEFPSSTRPFNPLEQLMGVFPAASRSHIPEGWRYLMTDEESPILDFYPSNFEIDLNGKKFAWQGVALLPFVDEQRLLDALKDIYGCLSAEEIRRNCSGHDRIFVGKNHPAFASFSEVYVSGRETVEEDKFEENGKLVRRWVCIDPKLTNGMAGEIAFDKDAVAIGVCYETLFANSSEYKDVKENACTMAAYRDPQFPADFIFKAKRLSGIKEIEKVLKPGDWDERRNGHFQPQIGFTRNIAHANVSYAGHRHLNNSMQQRRN